MERAPSTPARLGRRARAVLLIAEGHSGVEVARRTGYTPVQVSRIRGRFADERTAGLADRPRTGRPSHVGARQRARVLALRVDRTRAARTDRSSRDVARRTGLSHSTVHRIWQDQDLQQPDQ